MAGSYRDPDSGLNFFYYGDNGAPAPWPLGKSQKVQVFAEIVNASKASRKPFEDPYFPASQDSIGNPKLNGKYDIEWKRASEITAHKFNGAAPVFKVGEYSQFGVKQGRVGDCWFLSTLAEVAVKPEIIHTLIPKDNETADFETGIFHFRFWCRGKWVDIAVDDQFPCIIQNGELLSTLFCKPTDQGEFWAPLLEKAYAKLYGKYERIAQGLPSVAMKDFTGGIAYSRSKEDLEGPLFKSLITEGVKENCLMGISTGTIPMNTRRQREVEGDKGPEDVSIQGIVGNHAYSVLDIQNVIYKEGSKSVTLVKCRNPWGSSVEWKGDFSDIDDEGWKGVDRDLRTGKKDDGQYWIPIESLRENMEGLSICHWSKDFRGDESGNTSMGETLLTDGRFTKENSGEVSDADELIGKPGFYVFLRPKIPDSGQERNGRRYNCTLAISIMWKDYKKSDNDVDIPTYGFYAFWRDGEIVPNENFFKEADVGDEDFNQTLISDELRQMDYFERLPAGTVFIAPWIENYKGNESPYFLSITADGEIHPWDVGERRRGSTNRTRWFDFGFVTGCCPKGCILS